MWCVHRGLYGYKVFLSLGLLLGDAVWNVGSIIIMSIQAHRAARKQLQLPKAVCMKETGTMWGSHCERQ